MIDIPNYDEWKLSCGLEDEKVFCTCDYCSGEVYYGEDFCKVDDNDNIHEGCLSSYIKDSPSTDFHVEKVVAE